MLLLDRQSNQRMRGFHLVVLSKLSKEGKLTLSSVEPVDKNLQ